MALDRFDARWNGFRYVWRSVMLRLLATVLAFSCAITLIPASLQLNREDNVEQIGTLYVEATPSNLYRDLARTGLVILVSPAATTFLVALFTFYLLSRLVTRHLPAIARSVSDCDFLQRVEHYLEGNTAP